jgi:membrane protease subunit HflK
VRQVAETAMREVVGRSKMDFVLYEGRDKVRRRPAHDAADPRPLQLGRADHQRDDAVVQPPEQVQAPSTTPSSRPGDRARARNEGQAYANDVIPQARGTPSACCRTPKPTARW